MVHNFRSLIPKKCCNSCERWIWGGEHEMDMYCEIQKKEVDYFDLCDKYKGSFE
jgi:hypothetical protein